MTQASEVNQQIARTYRNLRRGMGFIAISFPLIFLLWTWLRCGKAAPGPSISGYYHSFDPIIGDIFVGGLCAIGVFLVLYRGFGLGENLLLDVAGICAVGIALFPTIPEQAPCSPPVESIGRAAVVQDRTESSTDGNESAFSLHGTFAVAFFLSIAAVALFVAKSSLDWIDDEAQRKTYRQLYNGLGFAMIVLPLLAWGFLTWTKMNWAIFALEAVAIWVFAGYWFVKGRELRLSEPKAEFAQAACRTGW